VGPIAGLGSVEKRNISCPCRELNSNSGSSTSLPVAIPTERSRNDMKFYYFKIVTHKEGIVILRSN
jgi:hypothetical protein